MLPIAIQLYSLRDDMANDVEKTLKSVKALGYDGVELAGFCGKTPEEIAAKKEAEEKAAAEKAEADAKAAAEAAEIVAARRAQAETAELLRDIKKIIENK